LSHRIKARRVRGLGPTGKFPQGKVHATDEGELKFALAADHEHRVVLIDFGKPVVWMGLPPEDAVKLGLALIERAGELEDGRRPVLPS
jgi:hypothetical protein